MPLFKLPPFVIVACRGSNSHSLVPVQRKFGFTDKEDLLAPSFPTIMALALTGLPVGDREENGMDVLLSSGFKLFKLNFSVSTVFTHLTSRTNSYDNVDF